MVVENADLDMYKEWFEEFKEKYKEEGYTVKPVPVGGGQIQGKQDNMMASGTAPDIIVGGDIHILSQYKYLVPLDELIKRDNADVDVDDFMPEIMDLLKKDGKTYYLPNFSIHLCCIIIRIYLIYTMQILPMQTRSLTIRKMTGHMMIS